MSVHRGKEHEYLGMNIAVKDGRVQIGMQDYIKEAIKDFGEAINCAAKTPASRDLTVVPDKDKELSSD